MDHLRNHRVYHLHGVHVGFPLSAVFKAIDIGFAAAEAGVKIYDKVKVWKRKRRLVKQILKKEKKP